jgi:anti-sigma regulatory factor (Ser/Thr protein kinase)
MQAAESYPPPTLTVPSSPRMLSVARSFVEAVCLARQVDRTTIHALVLATGEAVTNIVRHAHRDRPEAAFHIQCNVHQNTVEVTLLDEGEPFDVNQVPHLDPSEMRPGGRGVYLMRVLMDEIICRPRGQRGNELRLVKRWPSKACARECG